MKLAEGGKNAIIAKFWFILKASLPWNEENRKYLIAVLFVWLIFTAVQKMNEDDDVSTTQKPAKEKDVSTSIATMEPLLKIEQKLVQALNEYANQLQHKVDTIRRGIATMRKPQTVYRINEEEFLSNPFNSFPMLRRLKHEWKAWEKYLKTDQKIDILDEIHNTLANLTDFDLYEPVKGVERLREMYDIPPNDWTDGKLHFGEYEIHFTSLDCYALGYLLQKNEVYASAEEWLKAALKSYVPKTIYKYMGFNKSIIYETYVDNLIKQNLTELALIMANKALRRDANNFKLKQKIKFIENLNATITKNQKAEEELKSPDEMVELMKRGCRNEYAYNYSSQLVCFYNTTTNDFLLLMPFKVEQLSLDPIVMLYHDVISDDEIEVFKLIAKNDLRRSMVKTNKTAEIASPKRTSKNAWINNEQSNLTLIMKRRIADMTGFLATRQILVGNYGLGGHFNLHYDCAYSCETDDLDNCDRMLASTLFYMTTVEAGGATIFPQLQISVQPQKGTALFWIDLHNNVSECDTRTMHMGCPVLIGTKWFLINWLHFKDQMFRKPCYI